MATMQDPLHPVKECELALLGGVGVGLTQGEFLQRNIELGGQRHESRRQEWTNSYGSGNQFKTT
jgi:hypothetical protein